MKIRHSLLILTAAAQSLCAAADPLPADSIAGVRNIDDVVVTGTRNATDVRHLPMTLSIVGQERLRNHERPNLLPTLMEEIPGLMITGRGVMGYGVSGGGSGGMMLRGISSAAGQLMVLIDGHPQYMGVFGHPVADSYQTMMAERVEVLRGPASVLYGSNAMGGVINIVSRGMQADGARTAIRLGAGSYGTTQAEISHRRHRGRFSGSAAGQYARTDNHRPNMGFEQYGGHLNLRYDVAAHWALFADADVTHFNASQPGTVGAPMLEADQYITRGVAMIGVENHYERTSGRFSLYDNFGRHKINDGYAALTGSPQARLFRSKDALAGMSWYQSARLWKGSRLTLGADYQHIYGQAYYTSRATGERLATQNKQSAHVHNNEWAIYAELRQDLTSWLTLDAGLRYDDHSVTGGEWIPQGGIVVRPSDNGELKASVGKGFRNPTTREMYLYPPSNTELRPERLVQYELSWRQRLLQDRLSYGINLYYIDADNIIQTINRQNVNTGRIENRGIEIEAAWAINAHWTLRTNHSYLDMEHPVVAAPVYKGYLGADMHYGRWSASAGLMQVSGLYTAVGSTESQENFSLLNATVRYRLTPLATLWAKGDNLLAQRYEINAGYPMPKATFMGGVTIEF